MKRKLTWKERWNLFWGIKSPEPQYEIVERNDGWCTIYKHYYAKTSGGYKYWTQYLGEAETLKEARNVVYRDQFQDQGRRIKQIHYLD